ncbi:MAG: DUF3667 domain-containing protein [Bacteroidota bacterium]
MIPSNQYPILVLESAIPPHAEPPHCLNCGCTDVDQYCLRCGQKTQPTRLPLSAFLEDAIVTLFSIDSRWYRTITGLFAHPGRITFAYIEGKRASYLPPVRTYLSISILYFVVVQFVQSNQVFLIDFSPAQGTTAQIATTVKFALFFLVPIFGGIVQLFHRKRNAFYVEYLIFALHIHSVWLVLLMVKDLVNWVDVMTTYEWVHVLVFVITALAQLATFVYLVLYLKHTFQQGWLNSIGKAFGIVALYILCVIAATVSYLFIFYE